VTNSPSEIDEKIRLIGDAMHHAAYYESAKTGERKAASFQRMQAAIGTLLTAVLDRVPTQTEVEYLLCRGQCTTHSQTAPLTEPVSEDLCYECEAALPDGQGYWCLSLQNETVEHNVVSVQDAEWLRKWCDTCAAKLWFQNVIVPTRPD